MITNTQNRIVEIIIRDQQIILEDWVREQLSAITARNDLIAEAELRQQSADFFALLAHACRNGGVTDITSAAWKPVMDFLAGISMSRAMQGFSPAETSTFVFSLKQPIFARLRQELVGDDNALIDEIWLSTVLIDKLGLYTTDIFIKSREEVIKRQQLEMLELSTPVVKLWEGILAVPLIGTLDSTRTLVVMENLLQGIVDTGSSIAIVDITGVSTVDTLVAQHLLKTVAAARLMGAQCLISGIRPQIAQTMVHLGVEFGDVITKSSLADALAYAFRHTGHSVTRQPARV